MNIFDRLALEKEDDYWKTGPGYEAPKYQSAQANLYSDNARHYLAGPNKAGAEKPIQYMNGAKAPYEQGPSAEDKDTFKKAKFTRSQVFDGSGETLTETNLSEDGVETKVVKKTPSSLLDNESYDTPILGNDEVTYPSIATPPEANLSEEQRLAKLYQEQRELAGVRDLGVRYGDEPTNVSPFYSMKEGRHLLNHEYYGDGKASQFPSLPAETSIGRSLFGNIVVDQSGSTVENDTGTLAITDKDLADAQTAIIEDYNEQDMLELRERHPEVYKQVVAGEISMPLREDPHEGKDYTTAGFDGFELHAAEVALAAEEKELEEDVVEEATTNVTSKKDKDIVVDAITEIKNTNPEGIKVLNEFATWADTVSDEVAIKEAEDYLQNLKDSPSVDRRFRKAMAIGMLAMLFGDDFTTAMNTGFGVVADDYAAEEAAEAAEAATAAELAKTVAKENRANIENDRRKLRDFTLEMEKLRVEKGVEAAKEAEAEVKARTSGNQDWIKDQGTHYESILTDDQKKSIGPYNFEFEYDRALQTVKRLQPNVVWDLKNNNDQRVAFNTQFAKWFSDKTNPSNNFGKGVPAFENYMQDAFIKIRMEEDSPLSMKDTNPSVDDLRGMGINTDDINFKAGMEATNGAYSKIQSYAENFGSGGERATLALMAKDYYDWRDRDEAAENNGWKDMVKRANKQGIGGFIWYVNKHVTALDQIGTKYDPDFVGVSNEDRTTGAMQYLIDNGIVVTRKK